MRKFVTAGIGAAALAASVLGTAAPAGADTAAPHAAARAGEGFQGAAVSATAGGAFKRIGKIHKYRARSIRGAEVYGHWYWARKGDGPSFVFLVTKVKDTRGDGKSAAFCYDLTTPKVKVRDHCFVNVSGNGKTLRIAGSMPDWNHTRFRVRAAVGRLDKKKSIFYSSAVGPWLKVRWV
ncbi:hypothetical protein [Actinomadura macrotermitis]|uniref:Uncharacterized protein n=1 Tax=Actinomadura macrotermitis TaxID=2585200 RepID=A0A7K0C192_9ACTN|nr:hypothetical protein [Actinomadura macrotermitis]MQY07126.1 hypothetical protein [Actinomadura macrotermitis]